MSAIDGLDKECQNKDVSALNVSEKPENVKEEVPHSEEASSNTDGKDEKSETDNFPQTKSVTEYSQSCYRPNYSPQSFGSTSSDTSEESESNCDNEESSECSESGDVTSSEYSESDDEDSILKSLRELKLSHSVIGQPVKTEKGIPQPRTKGPGDDFQVFGQDDESMLYHAACFAEIFGFNEPTSPRPQQPEIYPHIPESTSPMPQQPERTPLVTLPHSRGRHRDYLRMPEATPLKPKKTKERKPQRHFTEEEKLENRQRIAHLKLSSAQDSEKINQSGPPGGFTESDVEFARHFSHESLAAILLYLCQEPSFEFLIVFLMNRTNYPDDSLKSAIEVCREKSWRSTISAIESILRREVLHAQIRTHKRSPKKRIVP